MPDAKRYTMNPKLVLRQEGKEGFIYDSETGALDLINQTALSILKLCNGKFTGSQIADTMAGVFGGDKASIIKNTGAFLRSMVKHNVIAPKK